MDLEVPICFKSELRLLIVSTHMYKSLIKLIILVWLLVVCSVSFAEGKKWRYFVATTGIDKWSITEGDTTVSMKANNFSADLYLEEDAPEYTRDSTGPLKAADSYEHALHIWKTPEDINAWIAANFSYDTARAMRLSESQKTKNEQFSIYHPVEFFKTKAGVCVDLSRFGVETLRRIDPQSDPKYLMIEFNPIQIKGNTLRLHWLVSFKRDGKTYFFADSKRPGHIAGPYNDTQAFINEYEQYRGRKIIAFRELASYQKQRRTQALQLQAPEKP